MSGETIRLETFSDVIADLQKFALRAATVDNQKVSPESLLYYAERIEAAVAKERREYERLHECFWQEGTIQNIVRQMLDERDDLRDQNPKASESIGYFAQLLTKAAQSAPGNAAEMREALVEILDRTNREKARDYDAALTGGILEIHDIANTALNSAPPEPPSNAAAMRDALNSIADIANDAFGGPERHREASQGRALSLIIDAARAALSAPARNCDARDANGAWIDFLARGINADCSVSYQTGANAAIRWLYAAAEGGAK